MKTTVFLLRHGETDFNVEKRIQGVLGSTLTKKGKKQARLALVLASSIVISRGLKLLNIEPLEQM